MDNLKEEKGIFCKYHPFHKVAFIKISEQNIVELKCDECIQDESCLKDYISIQTIKSCSDNHVFTNWPPVNSNDLLKNVKASLNINSQIIEQIDFQFDKIAKEITSYLASEKKKIIQQAISLNENVQKFHQSYQKIFGINKLRTLVNLNEGKKKNQIEKLKSFVSQQFKQKNKNTAILQEHLNKTYQEYFYQHELLQIKIRIEDQIDNFIKQIMQIIPLRQSQHIDQLFNKIINDNSSVAECKQDLQKISITKIDPFGTAQIYFNYDLTKDKKYVVRFKFNDSAGDCFNIGLLNKSDLSVDLSSNHLAKAFGYRYTLYSSKVVKGNHLYLVQKDYIVEMRINIKDQKLQFLDYPDYENINELNDGYQLNQNDIYHLAIQLISNSTYTTSFDLIYFQEIDY